MKTIFSVLTMLCLAATAAQAQYYGRNRGYRSGYGAPGDPVSQATMNTLSYVDGPLRHGSQYLCQIWGPDSIVGQSHCFGRKLDATGQYLEGYNPLAMGYGGGYYGSGYPGYGYSDFRGYPRRRRGERIASSLIGAGGNIVAAVIQARAIRQLAERREQPREREVTSRRYHFRNRTGGPVTIRSEELDNELTLQDGYTFHTPNDNPGFRSADSACCITFTTVGPATTDLICKEN